MTTAEAVRAAIRKLPKGKPFTNARFLRHGSRGAVDRTLSRLVAGGEIRRVARGVFVRPKVNRYVGAVGPDIHDVVRTVARRNGETLQVHGGEAIRQFRLSTQVPLAPVYHTSGTTRTIRVGRASVRLIHTSNRRLLQFAGEATGLAISALWYLGKERVAPETVAKIAETLRPEDFAKLRTADMPAWMAAAFDAAPTETAHG